MLALVQLVHAALLASTVTVTPVKVECFNKGVARICTRSSAVYLVPMKGVK